MQITAELKNWKLIDNYYGFYATGDIYNDTKNRWADGTHMHTSQIQSISFLSETEVVLITFNSSYLIKKDTARIEYDGRTAYLPDEATLLAFL